jgi:hypothetical protein
MGGDDPVAGDEAAAANSRVHKAVSNSSGGAGAVGRRGPTVTASG